MDKFKAEWEFRVLAAREDLKTAIHRKSRATGNYPESWDTLEANLSSGLYFEDPELLTWTINKIKAL